MHGNDVKFEFCDPRFVSYRKRSGLSPDVGVTTEPDPGCVKTLETVITAQQKNRTCGFGDSLMRERHSVRINLAPE